MISLVGRVAPDGPAATEATSPTPSFGGHVLELGLVDVKIAALDEDWSGLRVIWRREHRTPTRDRT